VRDYRFMTKPLTFQRRGVVEGFFGAPWSMAQRAALFELGAARGMNTYLYAPKDDPYHRKLWRKPYPNDLWKKLNRLIRRAQRSRIEFVYGFHPGEGLCFSDGQPIQLLLKKAQRFYDAGVSTFAVLFDDIPSRLIHERDRRAFQNSLARAEGNWLDRIRAAQPAVWKNIEWWICPSYYSEDRLLERVFGRFEAHFLETLARYLPADVACFWTGPSVVCKKLSRAHARRIAKRVQRPLLLWDNYPVNDLSMSDELHIGPLQGRDPRLAECVYGYLNNPMRQAELSLIPLATCFDYAAAPETYDAEESWARMIKQYFGARAWPHWLALREFFEEQTSAKKARRPIYLTPGQRSRLRAALTYLRTRRGQRWTREIAPWTRAIRQSLDGTTPAAHD
jgi:hyaluronoglucosaminidase